MSRDGMEAAQSFDVSGRVTGRQRARARLRLMARFGDLPLSWKLLLPSVGLIVLLGLIGGFLIVRDLSQRSQAALDLELSRRSLDAASVIRDRELSLIESANFASNREGISSATRSRDRRTAARLLQSVLALKTDVELLTVTDVQGNSVVGFVRARPGADPRRGGKTAWAGTPFVARALADSHAAKHVGITRVQGRTMLAMAAKVCAGTTRCDATGAAIIGIGVDDVAAKAASRASMPEATTGGVSIFDAKRRLVASSGAPVARRMPRTPSPVRINERIAGRASATLYTPFVAGGRRLGTVAVSIPIEPTLASVRRTALGLGLVLLAAMGGVALIGFLLSRLILRQVRSLVATNRALGRGDLSARAEVHWNDEIGEVGVRLNEMAEQLQATYETLESRVAERTEEVERLHRERTEFFASVSHELRTPLAVILRHAEMLLDDAYRKDGGWRVDAGSALKDSGGQLSRLIDDILELAEVEAGRLDVDLQPVDLRALLSGMRSTIEPFARAAGVRATVRSQRDLPQILADPRRIKQIVLNLVDNAVKYTPEGGAVTVEAGASGDSVTVSVSDNGVGIPEAVGDRIFEPFFRVKGTEPQRGQSSSGLGLAVARRLVEAQGGSITYRSTRGKGTTFVFTLPVADDAAARSGGSRHGRRDV